MVCACAYDVHLVSFSGSIQQTIVALLHSDAFLDVGAGTAIAFHVVSEFCLMRQSFKALLSRTLAHKFNYLDNSTAISFFILEFFMVCSLDVASRTLFRLAVFDSSHYCRPPRVLS